MMQLPKGPTDSLKIDLGDLDPELRIEVRTQLRKFSENMSPKFASMVSAEMLSAIVMVEQDAGDVELDISSLAPELREELRQRFETFSANLSPRLAEMLITSVEQTAKELRVADDVA